MYINKDLNVEEVKFESNFEESIWVNIKLNGKDKMLVGCLYKSPSSNTENLEEQEFFSTVFPSACPCVPV
jgi:hypothetical protein